MKRSYFTPILFAIILMAYTVTGLNAFSLDLFKKGLPSRETGVIGTALKQGVKASRPISSDEEYYIGRAVAAKILSLYPLMKKDSLIEYINLVGQIVALNSNKPFTYGGYHFAILDTNEVNAFACPGGIIFITRGMLNIIQNEDELAAVLAHEVAHINNQDGISSIKQSRWTEALTIIGARAVKEYGAQELSHLVSIFEGSIDDVFKTLVVNGYGQSQEYGADEAATSYLAKAGYNPSALKDFLERLIGYGKTSGEGILKTHPATAERIENIKQKTTEVKIDASSFQYRTQRFKSSLTSN